MLTLTAYLAVDTRKEPLMSNAVPQLGKVIFVGAGPGNPDLLTVRAREVLAHNAIAIVDVEVLNGVRDIVGSALPVPEDKLKAYEEHYEQLVAESKAQGARRKPPRPPAPTAADLREAAPSNGQSNATVNVQALTEGLNDALSLIHI